MAYFPHQPNFFPSLEVNKTHKNASRHAPEKPKSTNSCPEDIPVLEKFKLMFYPDGYKVIRVTWPNVEVIWSNVLVLGRPLMSSMME